MKRINDPVYLSKQSLMEAKEHQVPGMLPEIKSMVTLCTHQKLGVLAAPEAGVPFKFFVVQNPDPRDPDFDVIFAPKVTPTIKEGRIVIHEISVNGKTYEVSRWKEIRMTWMYHNGTAFERRSGLFQGEMAYIAQCANDRLNGVYVGADTTYPEVA